MANEKLRQEVKELQKDLSRCSSSVSTPESHRPKEMEVVYKHIADRELPWDNIATPALWASYLTFSHGQWRTLSNQILAMIANYHIACLTNSPNMTSPILSQEIEEKLPLWANYAPPAGTGMTDVRVADNHAKTL